MCLSGLFLPQGVMTLSVLVTLELAWMLQNGFAVIVYRRLPNRRQEGPSRLRMTLAFLIFFMWPRPWSPGRQWAGASKHRQCSFECISTFTHVCSTCPNKEELLTAFSPPNSTLHHHWSSSSINSQVCPQSIPIFLLWSSSCICSSLCNPLFSFFTLPHCVPVAPLIPSYLTP